jgi:hypothetical protein
LVVFVFLPVLLSFAWPQNKAGRLGLLLAVFCKTPQTFKLIFLKGTRHRAVGVLLGSWKHGNVLDVANSFAGGLCSSFGFSPTISWQRRPLLVTISSIL